MGRFRLRLGEAIAAGVLGGDGLSTLLSDVFTTDRAAGAVDGTACEPGPGVREVAADVGSDITIGSGLLNIPNGTGTVAQTQIYFTKTNGQGIWRTSGAVWEIDVKPTHVNGRVLVFLTPNSAPVTAVASKSVEHGAYFADSGVVNVYTNGTLTASAYAYLAATWYRLRFTLKTAGCKIEISADSGGTWTTLIDTTTGTSFILYPAAQIFLATRGAAFDNLNYRSPAEPTQALGDVYIIAGQSNASGRGTNNQAAPASGAKLLSNAWTLTALADPTDSNTGQIDAASADADAGGSPYPLLATSILTVRDNVTFVPCAVGGVGITSWLPGTNHTDRTTLYGSMVVRAKLAQAAGGTLKGVLWYQGETDAEAGMLQATYNGHLDTIANAINTDLGVPTLAAKLHTIAGYSTATINAAIAEAVADNANVKLGADMTGFEPDGDVHFTTDADMAALAAAWWTAIENAFYS